MLGRKELPLLHLLVEKSLCAIYSCSRGGQGQSLLLPEECYSSPC